MRMISREIYEQKDFSYSLLQLWNFLSTLISLIQVLRFIANDSVFDLETERSRPLLCEAGILIRPEWYKFLRMTLWFSVMVSFRTFSERPSCTVAFGIHVSQRYILRNVQYPSSTLYSPFQSPRLLSNTETNTLYILLPEKSRWFEKSRLCVYRNATLPFDVKRPPAFFWERICTFAL